MEYEKLFQNTDGQNQYNHSYRVSLNELFDRPFDELWDMLNGSDVEAQSLRQAVVESYDHWEHMWKESLQDEFTISTDFLIPESLRSQGDTP